jgi:peroxiredoxin
VIGLHDRSGSVEKVAAFAREHGLTFPLAIDQPSSTEPNDWFGATFQAYGIVAIPNAAVVDREGHVAYVGHFPKALQKAEELLGQSNSK